MASKWQSGWHMPQPVHWVKSMTDFLSLKLTAGQPIFIQALQPMHFSASTVNGFGIFARTSFRRTQGRREMMSEGASTYSSAAMASLVAAMSYGSTTRTRSMPTAWARASRSMAVVGSPLMRLPVVGFC